MKVRIFGLIAFNIVAMCAIVQFASYRLTMAFVIILLLMNVPIAMAVRRIPLRANSNGHTDGFLRRLIWAHFIPVLGGMICVLVGILELSWKPCLVGLVAIAVGFWRIWARGLVR